MTIIEAAKAMNEGKKVRRKIWDEGLSAHSENDIVLFTNKIDDFVVPNLGAYLADDWEIYEERSPMEKAWQQVDNRGVWMSEYNKDLAKTHFENGWNAAQKHFTEK